MTVDFQFHLLDSHHLSHPAAPAEAGEAFNSIYWIQVIEEMLNVATQFNAFNSIYWILGIGRRGYAEPGEQLAFNSIYWIPFYFFGGCENGLKPFNSIYWIHREKLLACVREKARQLSIPFIGFPALTLNNNVTSVLNLSIPFIGFRIKAEPTVWFYKIVLSIPFIGFSEYLASPGTLELENFQFHLLDSL